MIGTSTIDGLRNSLGEDRWQALVGEAVDLHAGSLLEATGLTVADLGDVLGMQVLDALQTCAIEDALAHRAADSAQVMTSVHAPSMGRLDALGGSVMSLYEVCMVTRERCVLRDLLRGGKPVPLPIDGTGPDAGQIVGARLVAVDGAARLSDGWLVLGPDAVTSLMHALREVAGASDGAGPLELDDETLRSLAPLFTSAWLTQALTEALSPEPSAAFDRTRCEFARQASSIAAGLMPA